VKLEGIAGRISQIPDFTIKPILKVDDVVYGIGAYPPSCLNATGIRGELGGYAPIPLNIS